MLRALHLGIKINKLDALLLRSNSQGRGYGTTSAAGCSDSRGFACRVPPFSYKLLPNVLAEPR
jgi:hypothetical protein